MKVEESQEGKQKTKKEIEVEKKLDHKQRKSEEKDRRQSERKQKTDKERQKEKEDIQRKTEEKEKVEDGNQNIGKERLKRIGSEKSKMKKCMFHLENR